MSRMDDARALQNAILADSPRETFSAAIAQVADEKWRVLVTRDGRPVAAIVPIEDYDALEATEDAEDERLAAEALAEWRAEGCPPGVSHEDLLKRYGIDAE